MPGQTFMAVVSGDSIRARPATFLQGRQTEHGKPGGLDQGPVWCVSIQSSGNPVVPRLGSGFTCAGARAPQLAVKLGSSAAAMPEYL